MRSGSAYVSDPTQRPLEGLTILVVDDHVDSVEMLQEYLRSVGAHVAVATSAKAALAITETLQIDAALVDLRLPCENGEWFLRQFRTSHVRGAATVPVYAVSGWPQDRLEPESGFAGYFVKPIDLDALVATLQPLRR
jgi:diguanylate cyclase